MWRQNTEQVVYAAAFFVIVAIGALVGKLLNLSDKHPERVWPTLVVFLAGCLVVAYLQLVKPPKDKFTRVIMAISLVTVITAMFFVPNADANVMYLVLVINVGLQLPRIYHEAPE